MKYELTCYAREHKDLNDMGYGRHVVRFWVVGNSVFFSFCRDMDYVCSFSFNIALCYTTTSTAQYMACFNVH